MNKKKFIKKLIFYSGNLEMKFKNSHSTGATKFNKLLQSIDLNVLGLMCIPPISKDPELF